jgi:hypothetical protein
MTGESLFDRIGLLLPPEQRELFHRRMAHLGKLNPNDEVLQVCEAMGFLALITRETPEKIAHERAEIERLFGQNVRSLAESLKRGLELQKRIEAHAELLPARLIDQIDAAMIADRIAAEIQRCFSASGLSALAEELRNTAAGLEDGMKGFSRVATALNDPKTGTVSKLIRGITDMETQMETTAKAVGVQLQRLQWRTLSGVGILCGGCIVAGIFIGVALSHV